jgi:hypothetical protein
MTSVHTLVHTNRSTLQRHIRRMELVLVLSNRTMVLELEPSNRMMVLEPSNHMMELELEPSNRTMELVQELHNHMLVLVLGSTLVLELDSMLELVLRRTCLPSCCAT